MHSYLCRDHSLAAPRPRPVLRQSRELGSPRLLAADVVLTSNVRDLIARKPVGSLEHDWRHGFHGVILNVGYKMRQKAVFS